MSGQIDELAAQRRVIAIELQGHGHTPDIDRPFSYEALGDDIAGLIEHLELGRAVRRAFALRGVAAVSATGGSVEA
jgi:pimeloyl-ACP methyl ester carboxylesterase